MADDRIKFFIEGDEDPGVRSVQAMRSAAEQASQAMATAFGAAFAVIAAGVANAIKTFADFEQTLNKISAVSDVTASQLLKIKDAALQVGADTQFSAQQAADGLLGLAKAGFTAEEQLEAIRATALLASTADTTLGNASEITAGILRGFGLEADQAGEVVDKLAQAANSSLGDVGDFATSMKYIAPIARASGQSLNEMTGILAALADQTIKGEQAGTTIRSILVRLADPPREAGKQLEKLGISIADTTGKMLPLTNIVEQFRQKTANLSPVARSAAASQIVGTEALSGFLGLVSLAPAKLQGYVTSVANSTGAAEEMNEQMRQGIGPATEELTGSIETLAIAFGESLAPVFEPLIRNLTESVNALLSFVNQNKVLVASLGLSVAAIVGFTAVVGVANAAVLFLGSAIGATLVAGLTTVLPIIAAVVAVVAALTLAWQNNAGGIRELVNGGLAALKSAWDFLIQTGSELFGTLQTYLVPAFQAVSTVAGFLAGVALRGLLDTLSTVIVVVGLLVRIFNTGLLIAFESLRQVVGFVIIQFQLLWDVMSGVPSTEAVDRYKKRLEELGNAATTTAGKIGKMYEATPKDLPPPPVFGGNVGGAQVGGKDIKIMPPPGTAITAPINEGSLPAPIPGAAYKVPQTDKESASAAKKAAKDALDAAKTQIQGEQQLRELAAQKLLDNLRRKASEEQQINGEVSKKLLADVQAAEVQVLAVKLQTINRLKGLKGQDAKTQGDLSRQAVDIQNQIEAKGADYRSILKIRELEDTKRTLAQRQALLEQTAQLELSKLQQQKSRESALSNDTTELEDKIASQQQKILQLQIDGLNLRLAASAKGSAAEAKIVDELAIKIIEQRNLLDEDDNRRLVRKEERARSKAERDLNTERAAFQDRQALQRQQDDLIAQISGESSEQKRVRDDGYALAELQSQKEQLASKIAAIRGDNQVQIALREDLKRQLATKDKEIALQATKTETDKSKAIIAANIQTALAIADAMGAAARAAGSAALSGAEVVIKSLIGVAQAAQAILSTFNWANAAALVAAISSAYGALSSLGAARSQLDSRTATPSMGSGGSSGSSSFGGGGISSGFTSSGQTVYNYYTNYYLEGDFNLGQVMGGQSPINSQTDFRAMEERMVRKVAEILRRNNGNPTTAPFVG